jgi:hypothetical protein
MSRTDLPSNDEIRKGFRWTHPTRSTPAAPTTPERLLRKIEAMPSEAYKIKAIRDALREARVPTTPRMMMPVRLLQSEWPPNDGLRAGDPRFDDIFDSVQREGIREPLTINLRWFVIDGNHRLSAARHLGLTEVPVRVWTGVEYLP